MPRVATNKTVALERRSRAMTFRNQRILALLLAVVPAIVFTANAIGTSIVNAHPPCTALRSACARAPISSLVNPTMSYSIPLFPAHYGGEPIPTEFTGYAELIPTQWEPNVNLLIHR